MRQWIKDEVQQFIKEHSSLPFRDTCPICGHKNTFSASIKDGQIVYNCFSASCSIHGRLDYGCSLDSIRNNRNFISDLYGSQLSTKEQAIVLEQFKVPDYWQNPLQNERCYKFMQYWGLLDLYSSRDISLYYDPKLDRCVFLLINAKGECCGATGRALSFSSNPKWYIYSRINGCPFRLHKGGNGMAILVEDCISACRASRIATSIGLLGTSISEATIQHLLDYSTLYIALDKDATDKSLKLQKQLAPYIDCKVVPLQKDIKYFNKEELERLGNELK